MRIASPRISPIGTRDLKLNSPNQFHYSFVFTDSDMPLASVVKNNEIMTTIYKFSQNKNYHKVKVVP